MKNNYRPSSIFFYALGILITLLNKSIKKKLKKVDFINKDSGETYLRSKNKKHENIKFQDVIGLQLLSYIKKETIVSSSGMHRSVSTMFEVNLILNSNMRIPLYLVLDNKEKAVLTAERFSVFLEKPLIINIEEE